MNDAALASAAEGSKRPINRESGINRVLGELMLLENGTDEQVKVCLYKTSSPLDNIPCENGVVFLEAYKSQEWFPAPAEHSATFDVRFFHPELFDKLLTRRPDLPRQCHVYLSKGATGYSVAVTNT